MTDDPVNSRVGSQRFHLTLADQLLHGAGHVRDRHVRAQDARRLMAGEGLDAGEAAFRVRYASQSQFGREYRRMFGESPHRDVAALKVETTPASHDGV